MPDGAYITEGLPGWEDVAQGVVQRALESLEFDELRESVWILDHTAGKSGTREVASYDQMRRALVSLYETEWFAHVPFDDGEALHYPDAEDFVDDILSDQGLLTDFWKFEETKGELLIHSPQLVTPGGGRMFALEVQQVSTELLAYFARHPEDLRHIEPRKFEELMAKIFEDQGYDVELTPPSRDGGRDLMLVQKASIGSILTLVECKRYAKGRPVGVEIVRSLYGVVEEERASKGLIATTSHFTKGAVDFRDRLRYRLELADYDRISSWLRPYSPK
ncbi:MAG: restriction endonuclease [Verrucomicrobiota bacterium]